MANCKDILERALAMYMLGDESLAFWFASLSDDEKDCLERLLEEFVRHLEEAFRVAIAAKKGGDIVQ